MKNTAKILALTFLGILVFIVVTMSIRLGFFKEVQFSYKDNLKIKVLYKKHLGPYHEILTTLEEVETWAQENKTPCPQTFGEFLDNPDLVETQRLRANVGCVILLEAKNLPEGIFYKELTVKKYLSSLFDGSPAMGPIKVYPKAKDIIKKDNLEITGAIVEIYTFNKAADRFVTEYIFPL